MEQVSASGQVSGFLGFGGGGEDLGPGTVGRAMLYWWLGSALWLILVWRIVDGY